MPFGTVARRRWRARRLAAWVLVLVPLPLAAQQAGTAAAERADQQRPGQPPPYYAYPFGPTTTEHRQLSMEGAIALALETASAYREAQIEARVASEDVAQARAAYFPTLGVQLGYLGTTPARGRTPDEETLASFANVNGIHETSALLVAGGKLDLFGGLSAPLRRSRELLAAAQAGSDTARRELALATIDAYFGLSLARQRRRIADESLALAESLADLTRKMAKESEDASGDTEVFRARAEALRRRDELEQARAGEAAASDVLRSLTGLPASVHVGVTRPNELLPLPAFERHSESMVDQRPELAQIAALERAAHQEAGAARAERRPQLSYSLSGGFDALDLGALRQFTGASFQLSLNVPLTDFGVSRSRETQARLRAESLQSMQEVAQRRLRQEFYTFRGQAFSALSRVTANTEREQASNRSLELMLARYRQRKATLTELIDAHAAYADARSAHAQAIIDYNQASARLVADPTQLAFAREQEGALPVAPSAAACSLESGQAPEIYGLRLGLGQDELLRRFPGFRAPAPDALGVVRLGIDKNDPELGLAQASLGFVGGRLAFLHVVFSSGQTWETKDAFLAAASAHFGLPGPWRPFYDWDDKTLRDGEELRDLAVECRGFRIRAGLGLFSEGVQRALRPHIKLEDSAVLAALDALRAAESHP